MKKVDLIVCVNNKNCIGQNNNLLYYIKDDLKHFKQLTINNVVVMGRKTFESLPNKKPLKHRINIILTRDTNFSIDLDNVDNHSDVYIVNSFEDLIDLINSLFDDKKIYVIGGSEIYKMFLNQENLVDKIHMTLVDDDKDGDAYFPLLNNKNWKRVSDPQRIDNSTSLKYQFITLKNEQGTS